MSDYAQGGVGPFNRPVVEFFAEDESILDPQYGSAGAAGFDLAAKEAGEIEAHSQEIISTGLYIAIPQDWVGKIESRSGITVKFGTSVPTGTLDSDYRGIVSVIMRNNTDKVFKYEKGQRIAQVLVLLAPQAELVRKRRLEDLGTTERGDGRFGSTDSPKKVATEKDIVKRVVTKIQIAIDKSDFPCPAMLNSHDSVKEPENEATIEDPKE